MASALTVGTDMIFFGCDPDTHHCSYAFVRETGILAWVGILKTSKKLKGEEAVMAMCRLIGLLPQMMPFNSMREHVYAYAVEAQQIIPGSGRTRTRTPQDIVHLAHIAGAMLSQAAGMWPAQNSFFPLPVQWKGSMDKKIHGGRILVKAGYPIEKIGTMGGQKPYRYPMVQGAPGVGDNAETLEKSDWEHVTDAVGLAQHAAKEYKDMQAKMAALKRAGCGQDQVVLAPRHMVQLAHSGKVC